MKQLISALLLAIPLTLGAHPPARADYATALRAYEQHDFATALRLLQEDGSADAAYLLGIMHYKGEGVKASKAEAVTWLKKAADRGSLRAAYNLGMIYDKGDGVPQDLKEAAVWYRNAGERGHAPSQLSRCVETHRFGRDPGLQCRWIHPPADRAQELGAHWYPDLLSR